MGMDGPKKLTLYEEVWECRFRRCQEVVEEPEPIKAFAPELAAGLDCLFGKI
jgi:hypothetical protein